MDEDERNRRLIHALAARLPWIVVGTVILAVIVTVIQLFLGG